MSDAAREPWEALFASDLPKMACEVIETGRRHGLESLDIAKQILDLIESETQLRELAMGGAIGGAFAMAAGEAQDAARVGRDERRDFFLKLAADLETGWPEAVAACRNFWVRFAANDRSQR